MRTTRTLGASTMLMLIGLVLSYATISQGMPNWIGWYGEIVRQDPSSGTIYAGDLVSFEVAQNQDYIGLHCELDWVTGGPVQMSYQGNVDGNSVWELQQRWSAGTYAYWFHGYDDWAGSIYENNSSANYTLTITAVVDPTGASAATGAGTPTDEIDLSWTKNGAGNNVLIVRSTDASFTAPTDGDAYDVSDTIDGDLVVYDGGGTSFTDSGLDPDATYYYKFYSINSDYYSAGATASAATDPDAAEPSISYGAAALNYTMIRGLCPADQTFSVTNVGGGTLSYTNSVTYDGQASGWLSVSITTSTLGASASEATTVSVVESNLIAGTYYATNTITGNHTNSGIKSVVVTLTVSDPDDPTVNSVAVDGAHSATRVDLSWARNGNSHDVMIVRSDDASFTAPSDGVVYNNTQSIGGDPVIFKGSSETPLEDTGRTAGSTYYYKFYSEHYGYYSAGVVSNVTMGVPKARNTSGGGVEDPSVTVYLGDTHKFGCDSWASVDGNFARWRVVTDTDADLSDGSNGAYSDGYVESENKTNTSARFTSTGTWYWGMQVDYGSPHGDGFWYVSDNASWTEMATVPTSTLTVDVQALPVVTSQTAVTNTANPTNNIDLSWSPADTPTASKYQVLIVRKSGSAPSAPTQGTAYSVDDLCGGGTVVYKGFDTSVTDNNSGSGLSAGTSYHYAFYSENYNYYSPVASVTETTEGSGAPFVPVPSVFRFK
jgi:hypothetical protein